MRFKQYLYFFILTFALCSGVGRDDIPLSKYYNFAKDPVFNCVGEMFYNNEEPPATCVLIDKKYIITAAHNFYFDSNEAQHDSVFLKEINAWHHRTYALYSYKGKSELFSVKFFGKNYKIKNIYINKMYATDLHDTDYISPNNIANYNPDCDNYDIAIAELESPVIGIEPATLYEGADELHKRAIICGFGAVERANEFNVPDSVTLHQRRKMAGENMIDSIGGINVYNQLGGLFFDFDAPNSKCCNRMGSSKSLPLEYFPDAGDCGGGLFINQNGKWKLAGLCASPDYSIEYALYGEKYGKYYGFTCYYQRIFAFKDWIKETITK